MSYLPLKIEPRLQRVNEDLAGIDLRWRDRLSAVGLRRLYLQVAVKVLQIPQYLMS